MRSTAAASSNAALIAAFDPQRPIAWFGLECRLLMQSSRSAPEEVFALWVR
jgi:hypothetical protein